MVSWLNAVTTGLKRKLNTINIDYQQDDNTNTAFRKKEVTQRNSANTETVANTGMYAARSQIQLWPWFYLIQSEIL